MTDQLEASLRQALNVRASQIPDDVGSRLRSLDYRPRSIRLSTRITLGAGVGAAATATTLVSVFVLGGTQAAFAGWSPTPTAPASGQVATAEAACQTQLSAGAASGGTTSNGATIPPAFSGQGSSPVLTDVRGPYTLAIYAAGTSSMTCFTGPSFTIVSSSSSGANGAHSASGSISSSGTGGSAGGGLGASASMIGSPASGGAVPAGQLQISGSHFTLPDGSAYTIVEGQTGAAVTGATFTLDNGQQVQATTSAGWFEAWWPGSPNAVSAQVTTASGTTTQPIPSPTALPGPNDCEPTAQVPCSASSSGGPATNASGRAG
jgi:hypothetical protein